MKVKKIECKQYAGLLDNEYEFCDGLNIVVGENESGKSTLADLLYNLFFQDTKLSGRNTTFQDQALPHRTGPYQGNRIDGTICFETDAGTARLTKEWSGKKGSVELKLPTGGYLSEPEHVKKYLAGQLGFGRGVYDEIAFTSQRRAHTILKGLFGGKIEKDEDNNLATLSAIITKTVMETGGIALDGLEKELAEKVASYEGQWDFANQMPKDGRNRGINNPWKNGLGEIIKAYYERERAVAAQQSFEDAEGACEAAKGKLRKQEEALSQLKEKQQAFSDVRPIIEGRKTLSDLLDTTKEKAKELKEVFDKWPNEAKYLRQATDLQRALQTALRKEKYRNVLSLKDKETRLVLSTETNAVDEDDYRRAYALEKEIGRLEAKIKRIDLSAKIVNLGNVEVCIRSSLTGEPVKLQDGMAEITEASEIIVPGIVEIQLFPKNVDVVSVKAELAEKREEFNNILQQYQVQTVEALQEKREKVSDQLNELKTCRSYISMELDGESWEELQKAADYPDSGRSVSEIKEEIRSLCPGTLEQFIGGLSAKVEDYRAKYGTYEMLQKDKEQKEKDVSKYRESLEETNAIPVEFAEITDTAQYSSDLRKTIEQLEAEVDTQRTDYYNAEKALPDNSAEELAEDIRKKEAEFERVKAEYTRWKHIQEVFLRIKEEALQNPFEDIARYFGENLFRLSDGRLSLGNVNDDLSSSISSGTSQLTANILSAGTKDTILLAFRLAVLKHLFPNGGCVAVFDDPFTDMDPKRTQLACQLLQEFAEHNQVIFTTCDDKYTKFMTGNVIHMSGNANLEA